jgi:MarR family transcriptional regulator, organic hydroperoxide resistance regulator
VRRQQRGDGERPTARCGEAPALGDVLEFMRTIWGVSHGLQSTSKRMEADVGITGPQRLVVRILGCCPGVSAGQLAAILHLHPSTLTGVLRRLEDRGVIERSPGERDRRQALLRLTASGRAVDRRHVGTVEDAVRRVLARFDAKALTITSQVLRALEGELSATSSTRPVPSRRVRRSAGRKRVTRT